MLPHIKNLKEIQIKKIKNQKRTDNPFKDNKINMLSLIPKETSKNYKIFVTKFTKNNQEWLRCWYSHNKGSGKQIEIKKYIDIKYLGSLLGQYQAEGTKYKNTVKKFRIEFSNKLIQEHKDFMNELINLGINKKIIFGELIFNSNFIKNKQVKKLIHKYQKELNIPIKYIYNSKNTKGSHGFKTCIRNVLLTEILLYTLKKLRKTITKNKLNKNLKLFADSFFSKLLTGDGTLDISNRHFPSVRIKITDGNLDYLADYYKIMQNLNFCPTILEKHISVRSSCSLKNLLYLHKINAFKNTNNWNKLLVSIDLYLKGRRLKTLYRFLEFANNKFITCIDIHKKYNVTIAASNGWLWNKEKENLVKRTSISPYPVKYIFTNKAYSLIGSLSNWQKDFENLKKEKNITNSKVLLKSLKIKQLLQSK